LHLNCSQYFNNCHFCGVVMNINSYFDLTNVFKWHSNWIYFYNCAINKTILHGNNMVFCMCDKWNKFIWETIKKNPGDFSSELKKKIAKILSGLNICLFLLYAMQVIKGNASNSCQSQIYIGDDTPLKRLHYDTIILTPFMPFGSIRKSFQNVCTICINFTQIRIILYFH